MRVSPANQADGTASESRDRPSANFIRRALDSADLNALRIALYQATGDASLLAIKLTTTPAMGGATNTYNYSLNFSMYGSAHPGGVNTVMCDGSVRLLRYTIDVNSALVPLCVRDDGLSFNADNL